MERKFGKFGTRRISDHPLTYECVCGITRPRSDLRNQGLKEYDGIRYTHDCPFTLSKLVNRRIVILLEPVHGFEAPTCANPVFTVTGLAGSEGYHKRMKAILDLVSDEWLTTVAVSFVSTTHLGSILQQLAAEFANFETFWVVSGHSETTTSRMIVNASANEFLYLHDIVQMILFAFREPSLVTTSRVRLIYFATCTGADNSEFSLLKQSISTQAYEHTCIILTPEKMLANELVLQDCFWLYRTTCMDNPLHFVSRYFSGYGLAPGTAGRRVIANGSMSITPGAIEILTATQFRTPIPLPEMVDLVSEVLAYRPLQRSPADVMASRYITEMTVAHRAALEDT
ncbi:hypothetical protein J8273_0499 [Carpediemonas membranifera]|uniref:Uncharacterized protein n=1 Tax=Carpediemonas membranifera TaxID=201153 RepID=A0A8J6E812_9EUKA|nr:hypothetical protein J8273_8453 [Carpediemonas membranifera]KAG9391300.1 hypothetical protein J8273_7624 [Carpediemonas membranifera]KAG9395274.1 hypothetical protein J8273_0499 [Carpediemonas membranifera]|eukprot:KAG9389776.1 hypothetical protein J8273_8453 [Carpediemonas membranifera]